jgi:hypothetical protein
MTGQEWRRRWQRGRPVSSALVDQSGLPRGGASSHIVIDEWRTTRWSPETELDRIGDQPVGDASDPLVNGDLVAAALGRLTQDIGTSWQSCAFAEARLHRPRMHWGSRPGG